MNKNLNIIATAMLILGVTSTSYAEDREQRGPGGRPEFSSVDTDGSGGIDFDEFSVQKIAQGRSSDYF